MSVKVEVSITRTFVASHSLPNIGVAERHEHSYELDCGYSARVDPRRGCARPLQDLAQEVDAVVTQLQGSDLNALLPLPPTAEMIACWVLTRLPEEWEWASIKAYDGFKCKVLRQDLGDVADRAGDPGKVETSNKADEYESSDRR